MFIRENRVHTFTCRVDDYSYLSWINLVLGVLYIKICCFGVWQECNIVIGISEEKSNGREIKILVDVVGTTEKMSPCLNIV